LNRGNVQETRGNSCLGVGLKIMKKEKKKGVGTNVEYTEKKGKQKDKKEA